MRGWRVYSLVQGGCDFTTTDRIRFVGDQGACRRWRERIPRWLQERPEIKTVFFTQNNSYEGALEEEVASYQAAWAKLPPSVEQVVVIRDNPKSRPFALRCVARAMRARRDPARACRSQRRIALVEDRAVIAAKRLARPNLKVIDLTSHFCDSRFCFPVVGGALVYAEGSHQTPEFNRTLAPYLLKALEAPAQPGA